MFSAQNDIVPNWLNRSHDIISLTSILCMVIEKLISIHIMKYVDEQGILCQFGFGSGRNCKQIIGQILSSTLQNP